jgi:HlyD family secretion protein
MTLPKIRRLLPWFLGAVVAGLAVYQSMFAPVPAVHHTVTRGEFVAEVMGTGTLEARVKTTVSTRIQERLAEVLVDQGDAVTAGQLLARLDDAEIRQQVAIAEATLSAARRTAERVRADLARSEAVLDQAQRDEKRLTRLVADNAVSQADVDKAGETLRVAQADLERSRLAIAEAESQIVVAEKGLLFRQEQLAFTEVHSPYDGLVIRRDRNPGDMLVPGASLLQIISLGELWVSAWVDETAMPALASGQPARVVFRSEPGRSYPGKVARLGREMDRESREFLVDVHATELPANWAIGQRAEVYIETARQPGMVSLPASYLLWKSGRAGVMVSTGGRARWREVTLGPRGRDTIAVTEGLSEAEVVVRAPDGHKAPLAAGRRLTRKP